MSDKEQQLELPLQTDENFEKLVEEASKVYYTFGKEETAGKVECVNTYRHQLVALHLFASQIGYEYDTFAEGDGGCFFFVGDVGEHNNLRLQVKFNVMRSWYNNNFMRSGFHHGINSELPKRASALKLGLENMRQAVDSKLFKRIYLQATKNGVVQVSKHILEFI